ncbi:phage shock protein PspD [Erwinia psidii]|uniref:Phage shock protein PspD n=1 Tax=Erwinia psidii TaxID=69224 RepID=A0A3N6RZN6_9GAMM|nr:phage shock protein PspD [Erwinia psidii]MCX8955991.1 phage shock protein PspD [Erwinia psidii]MCX8961363.1 phage shock protein PspD [Erwinia psidii]MCX8963791.1 phage shock protein PspD [Erwinia psidii]RQM38698.1 phage shock protein PspD [Erwinia psidii]
MRNGYAAVRSHVTPLLKKTGKFVLIGVLTYGPVGLTGLLVKSVARRPLKIALAWALEPLLRRVIQVATSRWYKP